MAVPHVYRIFQISTVLVLYTSAQYDIDDFLDMMESEDLLDVLEFDTDLFFEILDPQELSYMYRIRPALNFGTPLDPNMQPFVSKLVPTYPADCCKIPENVLDLIGNIALVERGYTMQCEIAFYTFQGTRVGVVPRYNGRSNNEDDPIWGHTASIHLM